MKYHPDKNPGRQKAEEQFKEATQAYEFLRRTPRNARNSTSSARPHSRARAPRAGASAVSAARGSTFPTRSRAFMNDFGGDSVFLRFVRDGRRGRQAARRLPRRLGGGSRGNDLQVQLTLTVSEIATGVTKTLKVNARTHAPM